MEVVASDVSAEGPSSVGTASLTAVELAVVVDGVVLEVVVATSSSAMPARSFLLGGKPSFGGPHFHLRCWEGSVSCETGVLPFKELPSSGMCSFRSVKCTVLLVSASSSSSNGSMSHFYFLVQNPILFSRRIF